MAAMVLASIVGPQPMSWAPKASKLGPLVMKVILTRVCSNLHTQIFTRANRFVTYSTLKAIVALRSGLKRLR